MELLHRIGKISERMNSKPTTIVVTLDRTFIVNPPVDCTFHDLQYMLCCKGFPCCVRGRIHDISREFLQPLIIIQLPQETCCTLRRSDLDKLDTELYRTNSLSTPRQLPDISTYLILGTVELVEFRAHILDCFYHLWLARYGTFIDMPRGSLQTQNSLGTPSVITM